MTRRAKRALDIVAAATMLCVTAPLLIAGALGVLITMGRPILFRQLRPGLDGAPFEIVKLRTMHARVGADGRLLPAQERLTAFGHLLRRTSIDELPELWNVLRGDMSLVGPRPLLMEYLPLYTPEQARRHAMRPGITGLAQVNGRHDLRFEDRFRLDVWYIDHWSLTLDLRILVSTVSAVLSGRGVPAAAAEETAFGASSNP